MEKNHFQSPLIGKQAPPFSLLLLKGGKLLKEKRTNNNSLIFTKSQIKGKCTLINFWASWCVSCKMEAQAIQAYWENYRKHNIIVAGIATGDTEQKVKDYLKNSEKTYLVGIDQTGKTSIDYGVVGVPETYWIDSRGVVMHKNEGPLTYLALEQLTRKFFKDCIKTTQE